MELYRLAELTGYALLRILPYLCLMVYIFRDRVRWPKLVTAGILVLVVALRCCCGLTPYYDPTILDLPNPGILILAVVCILCVRAHIGKTMFTLLMLANISGFTATLSKYLEGLLFPDNAVQLHRWTNSLTLLITYVVLLIPLFFYIKYIYTRAIRENISKKVWNFLWIVPFTLYAVWYRNSFFTGVRHETMALTLSYVLFCFFVSAGGMMIYTIVANLIHTMAENDRLRKKEYLLDLQQTQYENIQERIQAARIAKHDMRQHLHILSALLTDQKYDELEAYINRYRETVPADQTITYCEHYAVNALLQYFEGLTRKYEIDFSARVYLPPQIGISDDALTVLLGNLLENAVQACQSEKNASITVRGKVDENGVFFKIVNTYTGPLRRTPGGEYLSTKHADRGVGLHSVRSIVDDHTGMMRISHEGGLFTISVLLNSRDSSR